MNQSWTHFQDLPVPLAPHPVCRRHRHAAEAVQEALRAHQKWQVWNVYPLLSATFKGHWFMITYLHNCRYLVGRRLVNYYHPNRRSSSSSSATAPSWSLIWKKRWARETLQVTSCNIAKLSAVGGSSLTARVRENFHDFWQGLSTILAWFLGWNRATR